jgi:hypothetical protein
MLAADALCVMTPGDLVRAAEMMRVGAELQAALSLHGFGELVYSSSVAVS